jgi:polyisoprenoid-binding protein YceI
MQEVLMNPTRHRPVLLLLLLSQTFNAWAAEERFAINPANTVPSFEVGHMGFATQRGHFDRTRGMVVMDPQKRIGTVDISIDANSINTGIRQLDDVLREMDFLNVGRHPALSFRSTQMKFNGDRLVAVDGVFSMLGVSRPISLKVTHYQCGIDPASAKYLCEVDAEASFKRSDYGMSKLIPMVSDEVKLRIKVNAARDQ